MVVLHRIYLLLAVFAMLSMAWGNKALLNQEDIDHAYSQSYMFEKAQNYLKSMEALYPVLKSYPNGYTVNYRMGWLLYLNGNYADALKYYAKAIAIYPASIEVLSCVALVYKARLEWNKVEEENYKILKIDYFNQTANYWYAYALKVQKKSNLAENVCRKMLTVFPTSGTFLYELAENLYFLGKKKEALAVFRSVKTLDPYNMKTDEYITKLTEEK